MPQIWVRHQDILNGQFTISDQEAHHAISVLRTQVKDVIQLFDGAGNQYSGEVTDIDKSQRRVRGKILAHTPYLSKSPKINLFQGLARGQKFDFIIEKSVELLVDSIVPFLSQKNPVKLTSQEGLKKGKRWDALALAASKQSNRAIIPPVHPVKPLRELESDLKQGLTLVFDPGPGSTPLKSWADQIHIEKSTINVVVGPESGFSPEEQDWFKSRQFNMVSLGRPILRAESAGPAILAILNYELNRF